MKKFIFIGIALCALAVVSCTEEKKTYPIGDRAFFEVTGNVESIDFTQKAGCEFTFLYDKPTFTKEGYFFVNQVKYKESKKGENTILELDTDDEDGGVDEYVCCEYDKKGRLVCITWWECGTSNIVYDEKDRVVSYTIYGVMGMESEYKYTFTYGEGINPVGLTIEETHVDYVDGEEKKMTTTHNYKFENTVVDEHGNWLERKTDAGGVEKRTIKYYAE